MTGGIMPKLLFAVRWPVGVFVAVSLIAGTIGFATTLSGRPANDTAPSEEYAGERQQLLFFKAAVRRIDEELRHRGASATPSLRGERDAVLRRMREVAGRLPPERIPPDVAALLPPPPVAAETTARPRQLPAAKVELRELRTGLGARNAEIDFSSLTLDHPPPLPVYVERPPRRAGHARDTEASEKHADRPARERPVKDAKDKERAAEKSTKEPPSADRAAKERQASERTFADRPPPTVERTAVADQSERRPPAR
jgi:hypothetical protein